MPQDYDSSVREMQNSQLARRIEDWKSRLIDLSKRNNLLYFRRTKSNLAISSPDPETVFQKLVLKKRRLEFWFPVDENLDSKEQLDPTNNKSLKRRPSTNMLVCDGMSRKDLENRLKNLHRRSLSDYRERGVRILHAAFGMLVWRDITTSEEFRSPLIVVPIELTRETVRHPFSVSVPPVEEEVVLNPALQVKLRSEYKQELPPLPEEWEKNSLIDYLNSVSKVAEGLRFKVEANLEIGLFSFHKLVIYNDLDANAKDVIQHPLVRAIAGVRDSPFLKGSLPTEQDVDKVEKPENTYQVLDADSSQRVAIQYALQSQSYVMQGPPGTGKSQTIANIMSECIARGKSVLFVSDKMAALEVVYKRLREVGLAHFCLELHSSKANKREVVAELKRCLDEQLVPRKLPSTQEFERLKQLRNRLNEYVDSLHKKQLNLQKSAYEVLGELSSLERIPFVPVELPNPESLTPQRMQELEELVSQLKNVWQVIEEEDFPWRGYRAHAYNLEIRSELSTFIDEVIFKINSFRIESANFSSLLGLEPPLTFERANWMIGLGDFLLQSPKPEASWVLDTNLDKFIAETKILQETCNWCQTTRTQLLKRYDASFFSLDLNQSAKIEHELSETSRFLVPTGLEEGDLLKKLEQVLEMVRITQNNAKKWNQTSTELARHLGLPTKNVTVERIKQLARIASICISEDKLLRQWFNPSILEQTKEIVEKAKKDYQERNTLKTQIQKKYNDKIYELNLDELVVRYSGPYRSFTRIFRSEYRRDKKKIALTTHEGRVPKSILDDLISARKVKTLDAAISSYVELVSSLLGHFYRGYNTDFEKAEKVLQETSEIISLSGTKPTPENLIKLATETSDAQLKIRKIKNTLDETLIQWSQTIKKLDSLIPVHNMPNSNLPITQIPLEELQEWAHKSEKQLIILNAVTKESLEPFKQGKPQNYVQLISDLKSAEKVRRKEAEILREKSVLQTKYGRRFSDLSTNWKQILSILQWTKKVQTYFGKLPIPHLFANIISLGPENAPSSKELAFRYEAAINSLECLESRFENELTFQGQRLQTMDLDVVHERVRALRDRVDDLQVWIDFKDLKNNFSLTGLKAFFNRVTAQPALGAKLVKVFRKGSYQEWINSLFREDKFLGRFRRENHEQLITEFRKLDQELIQLAANMAIDAASRRKPQDILIKAGDSEVNTLLKEASKKRRLMPIRNLFQKIPHLLPRLKPCLLMSPITVSQFLPPGSTKFDLVLFDEASQIVPEDAISPISRGKASVIAGDNKQLPPTSFFQKSLFEEVDWDEMNDEDVEVFDSILDECLGIGLPVKTLRWHYRSRHEELIAFSNRQFYDNALVTFPSAAADSGTLGVKMLFVPDGIYDRGGKRDNPKEAQVITNLVFEHFQQYPNKTLGVVTFSLAQMETIEEAIENRLKEQTEYEHFFKEDRLEGFFVKNLENVQGDERDVMIFSVGYGRDKQGKLTLNFGPLNKPGGERRLNVAVTRAREKVILVTSIKASDIEAKATTPQGVLTLRQYLDYAEKGPKAVASTQHEIGKHESPLIKNVAEEIQRMEYNVAPQVGYSGYPIDIGVLDPANPGHFLLGVECDGATYQASNSARDRDRLREQVLKQLGWRIHRIWSPDWVARHDSETRRLKEALEQACNQHLEKENICKKPVKEEWESSILHKADIRKVRFGGIENIGVLYQYHPIKAIYSPYVKVPISRRPYTSIQKNEFHFRANRALQSRLLLELVKEEGPIHIDYAIQRLAKAWGLKRAGVKVNHASQEALDLLLKDKRVVMKGKFLWRPNLKEVPVRVPVPGIPETIRPPKYIPPEEIENAMKLITQYAVGISPETLINETAKLFGFDRMGQKIKQHFNESFKRVLREKKLVLTNNVVTTS